MIARGTWLLFALIGWMAGCHSQPVCSLAGTWTVERLGCTGHPDRRPGPVDATYTFKGDRGHTRWSLPGCTVEADFEVTMAGAEIRVREVRHTCTASEVAEGETKIPCCESKDVDLHLSYLCQSSVEGLDWTASLRESGPVGPWAGRGPWRGCPDGSLGMMRLKPTHAGPTR